MQPPLCRQNSSNFPYLVPGQDPPGKGGCPVARPVEGRQGAVHLPDAQWAAG